MNIFFGDSFTAGETCEDGSFDDRIGNSKNFGVSGTTIGEYSIYPVEGNSLLSKISGCEYFFRHANNIYIEYGINDVSAILCGFTTLQTVIISFVKAIDWIKQINPRANIIFLSLSNNRDIINMFAKSQCDYLSNDYFKGYNFQIPVSLWQDNYEKLIEAVSKRVKVIQMFDTIYWETEIGEDGLHPNDKGYAHITRNLL